MTQEFEELYKDLVARKEAVRVAAQVHRDEMDIVQKDISALLTKKKGLVEKIKEAEKDLPDLNKKISALASGMGGKKLNGK